MIFRKTRVAGAFIIDPVKKEDERGFFARTFCEEEFHKRRLETHVAQCNVSYNNSRGTLRGLHYNKAPHEETKLVRCTKGEIWDVVVDLRRDSRTYLQWHGAKLTESNRRMMYVPRGVAHGFITLTDGAEVFYQMSVPYRENAGRGARWNDPAFGIEWPIKWKVMNPRDRRYKRWKV